jgi:hypothetical protein
MPEGKSGTWQAGPSKADTSGHTGVAQEGSHQCAAGHGAARVKFWYCTRPCRKSHDTAAGSHRHVISDRSSPETGRGRTVRVLVRPPSPFTQGRRRGRGTSSSLPLTSHTHTTNTLRRPPQRQRPAQLAFAFTPLLTPRERRVPFLHAIHPVP